MKRLIWIFAALIAIATFCAPAFAAAEDVTKAPSCKYCGMNREKFAHSRMLIDYDDGSFSGTCSIHCAATELSNAIDKDPVAIKVGDYNTKELIDAEKATWVIGGDVSGVMTSRPKWAFANKADADAFISASKGSIANFEAAMDAAYADMDDDTKAIRARRKAKRMKAAEEQKGK
ncbi:NosL family protein [bacterium]|nr:MAG: NosL family protein [bacterium]